MQILFCPFCLETGYTERVRRAYSITGESIGEGDEAEEIYCSFCGEYKILTVNLNDIKNEVYRETLKGWVNEIVDCEQKRAETLIKAILILAALGIIPAYTRIVEDYKECKIPFSMSIGEIKDRHPNLYDAISVLVESPFKIDTLVSLL